MIGVDQFASVFGGAPSHIAGHLTEHIRAIVRAGWSPVLCLPGTATPGCILTPTQRKRDPDHLCGANHVIDNPSRVSAIVKNWEHEGANIGLHLGRSGLAVLTMPAAPGMSVQGPDGIGDWWFTLPEGHPGPGTMAGAEWTLLSGDHYVLVPPAELAGQGAYRLVG